MRKESVVISLFGTLPFICYCWHQKSRCSSVLFYLLEMSLVVLCRSCHRVMSVFVGQSVKRSELAFGITVHPWRSKMCEGKRGRTLTGDLSESTENVLKFQPDIFKRTLSHRVFSMLLSTTSPIYTCSLFSAHLSNILYTHIH
jgi:hypothetical protein